MYYGDNQICFLLILVSIISDWISINPPIFVNICSHFTGLYNDQNAPIVMSVTVELTCCQIFNCSVSLLNFNFGVEIKYLLTYLLTYLYIIHILL